VDIYNLSVADGQFLLERKFDYDRDERKIPDVARATRFHTGWRDAVASLSGERGLYTDLRILTWQNLGYRLGRVFGDVPAEVKATVFNLFSEYYRLQYASVWRDDVAQWVTDKHLVVSAEVCIAFFEQAFTYTRHPERAWFGVHQSVVSLVVGNVYLAAIDAAEGVWLLQTPDSKVKEANELEVLTPPTYKPVKSMPEHTPLVWLRLTDARDIAGVDFVHMHEVWAAYAHASALLLQSPQATVRDDWHTSKGKCRLSDFWSAA